MIFPKLDEMCADLLVVFVANKKPIRYNQLYRFLNEKGSKISRPTLASHLKHLTEKEVILRTEIDKQNVTYCFNDKKWSGTEEFIKTQREIKKILDEADKEYLSASPLEQVAHIHFVLVIKELYKLKFELLKITEPDKEFQHNLEIIMYDELPKGLGNLLGKSFKERDDSYRKEVLESIEKLLNYYEKMWPDKELVPDLIKSLSASS